MMKNFIFILLVGYAAGRVMSDDNFSGPDFALSGEYYERYHEIAQKAFGGGIFHVINRGASFRWSFGPSLPRTPV